MNKLSLKIAVPVILCGLFAVSIFAALNLTNFEPNFYIVLSLLTFFIFFFGFYAGQAYTSPIRKILEKANEMSGGKLETRVYLETKDELAELSKVFNQLAQNLQESQQQEKTMEQSLDMKVRAKTQALEETINALEQKVKNRTIEINKLTAELETLKNK